ncbi:hypothetical protein [Streptomyces doebereineriae]|uniref:DNA-binding protein n=1 Tax=Streptomyces doebereineriae TaxID=3075528 RepID=A0ABU2VCR7_9ACTN|nr:hypothetical protein [Streptomyces sp. DSM 41640]MDT0483024.1 hypothetical protein [Streptomyces sp. DSM 41640]
MLENWYFCAAVGLPPADAAAHLDTLAALREPVDANRSEELVCAALDFLHDCESGMILHALPHVLAAHRSFVGRREVSARAFALYRGLAGISPEGTRASFEALLREAGGGNQNKAVDLLRRVLKQVASRDYTADPSVSPYLDMMEQFAPGLLLTVGRFLARHRRARMRERLGDRPVLLLAALRGEHGRLALIQAAEWSATLWPETADEARHALALLSGGAFDMEPDLLMSAARVTFGDLPGDTDDTAVPALLDRMEREAMSGVRLLGWVEQYGAEGDWRGPAALARRQAAYVRLGGVSAHRDSVLPAVLWQHTLTALATELASEETAGRLEAWWQPPTAFPATDQVPKVGVSVPYHPEEYARATFHVGRLLRLRTPPPVRSPQPSHPQPVLRDGPAAETDPATAARVWSPWMLEPVGGNDKETPSGPQLTRDEPEQLIRLLGAGLIGERLLTAGRRRERQPDFLLLLTLHIKDVLGRRYYALRKAIDEHTGRSLVPGGHLAGLITHVTHVTDRVGKGLRPTVHPAEFLRVLQALHDNGSALHGGQATWGLVRKENGLGAALDWAKESAAGGVGPHRTEAGARWFVGDPSAADTLCDLVAGQGKHPARRTAVLAALLRREIHGADPEAPLRWDWRIGHGPVPPFRRGPETILPNHQHLLLSGPKDADRHGFSSADWARMGQDMEELSRLAAEEQRRRGETGEDRWRFVPLAARTLRLTTLLEQSGPGDEDAVEDGLAEEWVTSWTELITSLNSPQMLPRDIRSRLLDLFHVSPAGLAEQRQLIAVLERVVDAIIDLSPRAPLYYDRLFAEVGGAMTLPAESANLLRHRVLRSFYHRWSANASAKSRPHPFDTYGTRISARGTEAALIGLLRATAHLEFPSRGVPLAAVMTEAWERAQRPQLLLPVRQDMDSITLDSRRVAAATVDRRTSEVVLYRREEALDVAVNHQGARHQVSDPFTTVPDGPVPSGYVLGVVAAVTDDGRMTKLSINCGLPQLLNYPLRLRKEREHWKAGHHLAVRIEAGKISEIAPLAMPRPSPGEVRGAVLRTSDAFPWLSLRVDGISVDCYAGGGSAADIAARRLWDPDISRRFAPGSGVWPVRTLAMWHGEYQRWVPLDSGLAELSVAQGVTTAPDEGDVLRLVLCDRATDRGGHGPALRFALTPGRTYVLGPSDWHPEDWRLLESACAGSAEGLIVHASFAPGENRLRLAPPAHDGKVFDRRNIDWLAVFTRTGAAQDDADGPTGPTGDDDLYRKAFVETGPDGKERWCIEVPAVEGFPNRVAALPKGGTFQGRSVLCTVTKWGEREARRAEADVLPVKETGFSVDACIEHYDLLRQHETNDFVEVDVIPGDPTNGSNRVWTVDGISGLADTESLTLTGEFPSGRVRRWAIVTRDRTYQRPLQQRPEPFAHEDLVRNCRGLSDLALLAGPTLKGIVAGRTLNADHRLTHLRIWLRLSSSVVEVVDVPVSAFDQNKKAYVGNQLTASRTGDGWSFFVHGRDLRLRGLWTERRAPGQNWKSVGTWVTPDNELKEVFQDPRLPLIAVVAPGDTPAADLGPARAKQGGGRVHPPRAVVEFDHRTLVGTSSGEALTDAFQDVHVDSTELEIFEVDEEDAEDGAEPLRLVDVSRSFVLSPLVRPQAVEHAPAAPAVKPEIAWERLREGVIEGSLTDDETRVLLPTEQAPDDHGIYRRWLAVAEGPRTLVGGREYLRDRVRCVAVDSGRGARASHLGVPPVSLPDFLAEVLPHARLNGKRYKIKGYRDAPSKRPYYVGLMDTEEASLHRFEFGYGWFVDIPVPALTMGGKPVDPRGIALFHGDQVRAMSFRRDASVPGGISVEIASGDVHKGVESRVYDEAVHHHVLHLLDVSFDHARGLVLVERVYTGNRRLLPGEEDIHVKDERVSASLDPTQARALLAKYGPETRGRKVLARLEHEKTGPARKALLFTLVPPRPDDGKNGLRRGDRIYLTAGRITRTKNDHFLRFGLPQDIDLPEDDDRPAQPLTVKVFRRDFAHRENCLRRAMETHEDKEAVYENQATMLVRLDSLHDDARNDWTGSTKFPLTRPLRLLRSYLDETRTDCFGTVVEGRPDQNGRVPKYLEIRPGILFPADEVRGASDIPHGSVVRLRRHHDEVSAHVAVPADSTFLGSRPRPVVVFPKDRLRDSDALDAAHRPRSFTLAGLPGIGARVDRATGARREPGVDLLRTPHPKITGAVTDNGPRGDTARLVPLRGALAGRIVLPAAEECTTGVLVEVLPLAEGAPADRNGGPTLHIDWSRLSFMNGTAQQIAAACRSRYWRYHDRVSWYWPEGEDAAQQDALPGRARSTAEPVFFSPALTTWTLRHDPAELRRFGFPATELVENLRTAESTGRTAWAVAWADRHTLWLELAPGRVVEICAELVRFSDGGSLADLDWSFFAPGDLVYGRVEGGVNECGHLTLDTWHPGVRGALGSSSARRMLLPVDHLNEAEGALLLGEGASTFPYPADRRVLDAYATAGAVWLNRANELTALVDSPPSAGDVVFLSLADGVVSVQGLPRARVLISAPSQERWPDCDWLREALISANRGGVLDRALSGLPVTVEHITADAAPVLTVSRRAQPGGPASTGSVLVQPLADLGHGHVAVRSGSALFRVHMHDVLPTLPETAATAAAAALVEGGRSTLRLYWDARTRKFSGRPTDDHADPGTGSGEPGETTVRPLLSVNDAQGRCLGLICHDERDHLLTWLDAADAAWTADLTGDALLKHLRDLRRIAVLRTAPGAVTLTGLSINVREYGNLTPGQRRRVTVVDPAPPAGPGAGSIRRCVVSVEPLGILAEHIVTEGTVPPPVGETLSLEVSRVGRGAGPRLLSLVEPGSRLTVADLPAWTIRALASLHDASPQTSAVAVDGLIDPRFDTYRSSYQHGLDGAATTGSFADPACEVLRVLGAMDRGKEITETDKADASSVVRSWLHSPQGRAAVLQQPAEVDVAPLLAACWLGIRAGARSIHPSPGWVTYLLARLGDRAISSLHTEALVTQWLVHPQRHMSQGGDWRRLRTVEIASKLTPKQVSAVRGFGEAVTSRPVWGLKESEAAPVARSLLAAVGALPAAQALRDDAFVLRPLVDLAAGLRPPRGKPVPDWSLLHQQQMTVRTALDQVVGADAIPLTLLPAYLSLTREGEAYGKELLRATGRELPYKGVPPGPLV